MKEINDIDLGHMNNGAHFMYVSNVLARIETNEAALTKASVYINALKAALEKEDEVLKLSQKNFKTDDIVAADSERDKVFISYKATVKSYLKLPMEEMAQAAKVLNQSLKDYDINPRMQLDRETGLLRNLISDLENKYSAEVTTLGLSPLVAKMKEANEKVAALLLQRDTENSSKVVGALKAARLVTDEAYRLFVRMVNSLAMVEGDTAYASFIDEMNTQILRYKREVLGQKASGATADTDASGGTSTDTSGDTDGGSDVIQGTDSDGNPTFE